MNNEVHSVFKEHILNWAQRGAAPDGPLEMSAPTFIEKLGVDPKQFSFKTYAQETDSSSWEQTPLEFPEVLEGTMYMFIPGRWYGELKQRNLAQIFEGKRARQSLILASKDEWKDTLHHFFEIGQVASFAYYPIQPPYYDQWIACVDLQDRIWLYTFYGAGEWVLVLKGDAGGRNTLKYQVTSSVHSSPWYSWIASS